MTVLDQQQLIRPTIVACPECAPIRTRDRSPVRRSGPSRPGMASPLYRGTGVAMSRASHAARPVGSAVTIMVSGLAALITMWLGTLAHFSDDRAAAPIAPSDQLAVVQVQAGETLQQLAGRIAPDAAVEQVVDRIRQLNGLDSVSVDAGQTLIAPVG